LNQPKPKILIVDDTPANLVALNAILNAVNADVIRAASGNDALALVIEHDFALFLFDVQMPGMDGYELSEILSNEPSTKDIPIIFLTAAQRAEIHYMKGYAHGAIDYIEKPINDDILLAKVSVLLRIWEKNNALNIVLEKLSQKNTELKAEVARRVEVESRLDKLAKYDLLTNLPNRTLLSKECEKSLSAANRYQHQVGFMFLDLDGFKQVNDTLGHEAGDAVLIEIAQRFRSTVRDIDIVSRYGGDEFIIVLPDCRSAEDVEIIAKRIIANVNQPFDAISEDLKLGVSIGIAMYKTHAESCEELINMADKAMYRAKKQGKNQFKFFE